MNLNIDGQTFYESATECIKHGGHCFKSTGVVLTSNPPQYPEKCKHCPARRTAVPRELYEYY